MSEPQYSTTRKSKQYSSHGPTGVGTTIAKAKDFWRHSQEIREGHPAQLYLASRHLWPLLPGEELRCGLRYDSRTEIDHFYLVASLIDFEGELTAIQYLRLDRQGVAMIGDDGHKDRVTIGPAKGCAFRPLPLCPSVMGVAEGLETAMAVRRLYDRPCFATLGAKGLRSFRPPYPVRELIVFADHDKPGMAAAFYLQNRLNGLRSFGVESPEVSIWRPEGAGLDFADVWESQQ